MNQTELEAMEAAGLDLEAVKRAAGFFSGLRDPGPEGRENRLLCLRALAELARENAAARLIVTELLDAIAGKLPAEAATFRGYYLDGDTKPSAHQLARVLYMDRATVFNHTRRIFAAMLPAAFPEFEEKPNPRPCKKPPKGRRAFFVLLDEVARIACAYREEAAQEPIGATRDGPESTQEAGEG